MALRQYREKRSFGETPEPRGGRAGVNNSLAFVVQKHAASRLHYDFRLQVGSVLASWAVPKGPSTTPGEKRLAVHVEDHPLEYGSFEGVIPKGHYGAGTVEIWDKGTWIPEGDPRRGLRAGSLKFRLKGRKLKGSWALVRMAAKDGRDGGKENWLLIKHQDAESSSEAEDPSAADRALPGARRAALPTLLKPQLATLVQHPPAGDEWLHEIKFDGYRLLARVSKGHARLYTRGGNDWTRKFDAIAQSLARLPVRAAWLDGEVVAPDAEGRHSFQALQRALKEGAGDLVFHAFDLMHLDGWNLSDVPLEKRKKALARILPSNDGPLRFSDHVPGSGLATFTEACRLRLEGIVSKRRDGAYHQGRGTDWRKSKCQSRQEFLIGGFTDPGGNRKGLGALLLGVRGDSGKLRYAGRVGTGFDDAALAELHLKLAPREIGAPPFQNPPAGADARGVHWVRPELECEVSFTEWTSDGRLRHPSFLGLRADKRAREVRREKPIALTHPDRVLYPETGLTKADLAAFYRAIGDFVMPGIKDRPLSLVRCPGGHGKGCFYQKHLEPGAPPAIRSIAIAGSEKTTDSPWIRNLDGLIGLVQMGVLEFHPWGSRIDDVERPDRIIFDIDPDVGLPWARVVESAMLVRHKLEGLGLETWLKTTGGKGVHIVVPVQRRHEWPLVKAFAHAVALDMARRHPDKITAVASKVRRKGRIFLDYLRNARGATAIAAYSTRARSEAPVATPIAWEELPRLGRADRFNVRNLPKRLASLKADPWADLASSRQSLTQRLMAGMNID